VLPGSTSAVLLTSGAMGVVAGTFLLGEPGSVVIAGVVTVVGVLAAAGLVLVVLGSLCAPRLVTTLGPGRALGCGLSVVAAGNILLVG